MKTSHESPGQLRSRAEKILAAKTLPALNTMSDADILALVHELQVHQVELEMQNEELVRAHAAAEEASERFRELFDFAPIAYFELDEADKISRSNLAAAKLLSYDCGALLGQPFELCLRPESRMEFAAFSFRVREKKSKLTCELKALGTDRSTIEIRVEGQIAGGEARETRFLRLGVTDITALKYAEIGLLRARAELEVRIVEATAKLRLANQKLMEEIRQRKLSEERVTRLASFPELNPNPIIEVDSKGAVTFTNEAAIEFLAAQNIGQDVSAYFPTDISDILQSLGEKQGAETFHREVKIAGRSFRESIFASKKIGKVHIHAYLKA